MILADASSFVAGMNPLHEKTHGEICKGSYDDLNNKLKEAYIKTNIPLAPSFNLSA